MKEQSLRFIRFSVEALGLNRFTVISNKIIDCNKSLIKILDRNDDYLDIQQIVHPNDVKNLSSLGKNMVTVRLQNVDGTYMWFSLFANNEVGFSFNVDEAVKTREILQMTGKGFQLASVASSLIFWSFDLETGTVSSLLQQPTIMEVLSVDPRAKFDKFMDFIADEERPKVQQAIVDIKRGKISEWTGECRIMKYRAR